MNARRFFMSGFVLAAAATVFWLIGTTDNPVRRGMHEGVVASRDLLTPELRPAPARDPLDEFAGSLTPPPAAATLQGTVYVPGYAHIRLGSGRGKLDLATTLSIHNTSADHAIALRKVTYHGTDGGLVETLLDRPIGLKPLATIEFFVASHDRRAGSGANFVLEWAAAAPVPEPAAEAVMIGTVGTTSYSFVSQGRAVRIAAAE